MAHAKPIRFCFVSDSHGDRIDRETERVFKEFVKWWKPKVRVHGGDAFDLRAFRTGVDIGEAQEALDPDIDAGLDFLQWYSPDAFLLGNHEKRVWDTVRKRGNGPMRMLANNMIAQVSNSLPKTKIIPYHIKHGIYEIGDLRCVHGYHHSVHAPMKAADLYCKAVMGHIHTVAHYSSYGIDGPRQCWSAGCICNLDMGYDNHKPGMLRHGHGWVYGQVSPRGETVVWQAQRVGTHWVFPSEYKEIRCAG